MLLAAPSTQALDVLLLKLMDAGLTGMLRVGNPAEIANQRVSAILSMQHSLDSVALLDGIIEMSG